MPHWASNEWHRERDSAAIWVDRMSKRKRTVIGIILIELVLAAGWIDKSSLLRSRLDDCLMASPELAYWLKRWQAEDATA
jgi:hypothetical protein